ncbi:AEC family transporter [Nocardioides convexus]|uniref:AEC family transporter n=1 Tax=Nocardioides convexus TaxID=2712224 RepID=UPI00241851CA|nr:AEC family transporter [Nocardioides convexus]
MGGVLEGFATLAVVIALGALLAHVGIIDLTGQRSLSLTAFYVASPALLVTVLEDSDPSRVLSGPLVATAAGVVVSAGLVVALALSRRRDPGTTVIAMLCAAYVNAGNLGIPIAAYALGDAALVVPALMMQSARPAAARADRARRGHQPTAALDRQDPVPPGHQPADDRLLPRPRPRDHRLRVCRERCTSRWSLVGGMAVPAMLIAYGVALRLGPLPGRGVAPEVLASVAVLKMVVQPVAAYLVGRFAVGIEGHDLFAVTLLSALPTAQNVFVIATRYDRGTLLARDAIFVTTLASVPVAVVISALLA